MSHTFYLRLMFITCLLIATPSSVLAYEVQPISISLAPSGRGATKDFKVINSGTAPIAIQVSMVTRRQNLDGSEQMTPAESNFVVYPQQMVIKERSSQSVRVQWLGAPSVVKEESYRFIIKQIPVNLEYVGAADKAVKFNVTMEGALYVRPDNAKSNIIVSSAVVQGKHLHLVLTNQGSGHSALKNTTLILAQEGHSVVLKELDLPELKEKNILAGARRRFVIPLPRGIQPGKPISASIKYREMISY